MLVFRVFVVGVAFLFLTILINALANSLKFTSWYIFLGNISSGGFSKAFAQLSIPSFLWLFIGYPLSLGMLVYFLRRLVA